MSKNANDALRKLSSKINSLRRQLIILSKAPAVDVYKRMEFNGQIQSLRWVMQEIRNMQKKEAPHDPD